MTVQATLSRGGTVITFPILDEAGQPLAARDLGAPNHDVADIAKPNPRPRADVRSKSETITITTRLYLKTQALALADLIKAHSGGTPTILDIPLDSYESNIEVFPAAGQEEALSLEYVPGTGYAQVELALSRVDSVRGVASGFRADTPRASGDGPIVLAGDGISVEFPTDITVSRSVGRPNTNITSRYSDYPVVTDERQSSYDAFSLSLTSISDAATTTQQLRDMFLKRRGRDSLTLDFNGVHGMGRFNVVPSPGGQALRHVHIGGRAGNEEQSVPTIDLRVVQ